MSRHKGCSRVRERRNRQYRNRQYNVSLEFTSARNQLSHAFLLQRNIGLMAQPRRNIKARVAIECGAHEK